MPRTKNIKAKNTKAKVIALRNDKDHAKETILQQADAAKQSDDLKLAEELYEKQLDQKTFDATVYTKLMIVYRKQKRYAEELDLINKGLEHFKIHQTEKASSKNMNASIKKLSSGLNKSLGLTDKKGNSIYEPEPIPSWKRRKISVEKKIKTASGK